MRGGWGGGVQVEVKGAIQENLEVDMQAVNSGYFQTLGLELRRALEWHETDPYVGWVADHVDDGTRCDHALDLESVHSSDFQDEEVST